MAHRTPPKPASPTIAEALDAFLADQEPRLAPKTFARYEAVIDLLQHCLDGYGPNGLSDADAARFDALYNAKGDAHRKFCEVFGPEHILRNLDEFLGYFMVRKVIAGAETLRAAGTVTRKLAAWLAAKGYVSTNAAAAGAEQGRRAARNLPAADRLARALALHAENLGVDATSSSEGHFTVRRVDRGKVWLEALDGSAVGPIAIPEEVSRDLAVGWTISGVVGRGGRRWVFIEVWNVYPA